MDTGAFSPECVPGQGKAAKRYVDALLKPGDAIAIPPGLRHQITAVGEETLRFLCCCAPAYENDDTILVDNWP